jgi:2,3-bisphosphoglycerate-dependent phosphoglycerate mutase
VAPIYRSSLNKRPFVVEVIRSRRDRRQPSPLAASNVPVSSHNEPGTLVLVRHGESEFNRQDRFTGLKNPPLTPTGVQEAIAAGRTLQARGFTCDVAFTSKLKRAQQSLRLILKELHTASIPIFEEAALNERDYGVLAGMTRQAAARRWGDARVQVWRRSYDVAPPSGESLAMTAERTLPFLEQSIMPLVGAGRRVLVVAHGNSLRSIVMSLDRRTREEIVKISFATGTILIYHLFDLNRIVERVEISLAD